MDQCKYSRTDPHQRDAVPFVVVYRSEQRGEQNVAEREQCRNRPSEIWRDSEFLDHQFRCKFQEGEELYLLSSTKLYGYFEVSNGEKCGYVKEEELEPLYTTSWQAKDDQVPIYEAIPYEVQTANAGKATLHKKGDQIVGYLRLGESFTKRSESKNGILIETSSGIIGYVDSGSVEEVKTPIE